MTAMQRWGAAVCALLPSLLLAGPFEVGVAPSRFELAAKGGTRLGQTLRQGKPDPLRSPGHQRAPPGQVEDGMRHKPLRVLCARLGWAKVSANGGDP